MTVILSQDEVLEAVRQWCNRRFPVSDEVEITWQIPNVHISAGYEIQFTIKGVEMPPKDGPYR